MSVKPPFEKMAFQLGLRRRGISDQAVLRAMDDVPREDFVGEHERNDAYRDTALPIACGQTISQPFVVAYMTEQLQLRAHHRVLEIGTGSGYQAAILSRLVAEVVTLERYKSLGESARARLSTCGCANVDVRHADGLSLPEDLGAFDRIIVTAAVGMIPEPLISLLTPDGILIAPVGPPDDRQTLMRVRRTAGGHDQTALIDVRFVPALPGLARGS